MPMLTLDENFLDTPPNTKIWKEPLQNIANGENTRNFNWSFQYEYRILKRGQDMSETIIYNKEYA